MKKYKRYIYYITFTGIRVGGREGWLFMRIVINICYNKPDVNLREFRDPSIAPMVVWLMQIFHSRSPYPYFSNNPFINLSVHISQIINGLGLISFTFYSLNTSVRFLGFNNFLQIFSSYSPVFI